MQEKLVKFSCTVFELCKRTDTQTDAQTDRLITHTHTHNRFTALLEYVQDHPGEQVLER